MNREKLLSIILLSYFSKDRIAGVYNEVSSVMDAEGIPFELIIVDDGSKDESFAVACELEAQYDRVKAFQLSRNYTTHYAKFAGFSLSKGGCATSIPDDLQMPLNVIVKMYRLWEKGEKIVIPFRASRNDGKIRDYFSNSYYKIMNSISVVEFPQGGADGFLVDREILDILNERIHPKNTSTVVEVLRLGFNPVFIPYDRPTYKGKSRWTLKKRIKLALDTILSSSSFPIKLISLLGGFSVLLSVLFITFSLVVKLSGNKSLFGFSIPGWTSSFILISFFSGLILFSLGVIAEYIWRIYEEVKDRPGYIIRKRD